MTPDVVLTSIVRNGMTYLRRYREQVEALSGELERLGGSLKVWVAEGDSVDDTFAWLIGWAALNPFRIALHKMDHGGPLFGSENNPVRWRNIAKTWNSLYAALRPELNKQIVVYVEADLFWDTQTMLALVAHVNDDYPAVAPMSMHKARFYDTWGHRGMDGRGFGFFPPYHTSLDGHQNGLVQIKSAGSCMAMLADVAKRCTFSEQDAMLGHSIYEQGYTLWLDPALKVEHP